VVNLTTMVAFFSFVGSIISFSAFFPQVQADHRLRRAWMWRR
jgi:hypothetical protein